jgi:hypothetical protein
MFDFPFGEALILVISCGLHQTMRVTESHAPQDIAAATQLLTRANFEISIVYRWKYILCEGGSVWAVEFAMLTHLKQSTATTDTGSHC